jgi:FkbM family methyltransferase
LSRLAELAPAPEHHSAVEGPGAQFGEDAILEEIFGAMRDGYCVEVGAYDGLTGSATLAFERRGWTCLLVEPIPECAEAIRRQRRCRVEQCAASAVEGEETFFVAQHVEQMSTLEPGAHNNHRWIEEVGGSVRPITVRTARLDDVIDAARFPEIQFITIDVEGHELQALRGFSLERFQPRVVIIEENQNKRSSDVARHMRTHGYVNFKRTGVNEWYARADDTELIRPDAIRQFRRQKRVLRAEERAARFLKRYAPAWAERGVRATAKKVGWKT